MTGRGWERKTKGQIIPGVEITTYHGHANVWPIDWPTDGFVEFRCSSDDQMARVREVVRARGALFSVNHPKESGPSWEFGDLFELDCIEGGGHRAAGGSAGRGDRCADGQGAGQSDLRANIVQTS